MAVFCDLEDDEYSACSQPRVDAGSSYYHDQLRKAAEADSSPASRLGDIQNIMVQSLTTNKLAAALTCYPYASDGRLTSPRY
jgi:hypothetical protein